MRCALRVAEIQPPERICEAPPMHSRSRWFVAGFVMSGALGCSSAPTQVPSAPVAEVPPPPPPALPCGGVEVPHHWCISQEGEPQYVLAPNAPTSVDPCTHAVCEPGWSCTSRISWMSAFLRLESFSGELNLPRCVPGPDVVLPPRQPTPDPCTYYVCPRGYVCNAPGERSYCQAEAWREPPAWIQTPAFDADHLHLLPDGP